MYVYGYVLLLRTGDRASMGVLVGREREKKRETAQERHGENVILKIGSGAVMYVKMRWNKIKGNFVRGQRETVCKRKVHAQRIPL